nr:hypothetical protein [Halocatena pleomorpha]
MTQTALAGIILISTLIVYFSETLVGILGTIGWGFFAATFFAVVALGLNWTGAIKEGATTALVSGLVINLFYSAVPRISEAAGFDGIATAIMGLYPFPESFPVGTVALLVTIVLFVAVSIVT